MIRNPCPKCGAELEQGYGLAGGGMGPYEFCPKVVSITRDRAGRLSLREVA